MSQTNPSVTPGAPSTLDPFPTRPQRDGAPPKIGWRQYVADLVKAPAKAKAALIGSLMLVAISPSALSALTPFVVPAYAMKTGTPPPDAILLFVTLPLLIGPLILPFAGRWADRQGARRVALPAVILYAISMAAVPLAAGRTWLLGTLLVVAWIFGFAASLGVVFKVISTWFPEHRGIGFGLIGVVSSLASAILSPVLQWLVNGNAPAGPPAGAAPPAAPPGGAPPVSAVDPGVFMGLGWNGVYYVIAIAIAVVGIPAVLWLLSEPKAVAVGGAPKILEAKLPGVPLWHAVRGRAWIFVVLLLTLASTGPVAIRQNAVDLYGLVGINSATVSLGLSVLFSTSVVGLLLGGTILDRARHPWIVAVLIATVPLGLALALINRGSVALLYVSMALLGFATGAESALGPALIARYCGLKSFGALQGLSLAITGPALALAPYAVSELHAISHSYSAPLYALVGLTGIAVVIAASLPKYPRPWVLPPITGDAAPSQPAAAP